jgi:hypothetical protein
VIAHGLPVYVALAPVDMRLGYHSLCGPLRVRRFSYRSVGVRNEKTCIPLDLLFGPVEGATPALAFNVAQSYAKGPLRLRYTLAQFKIMRAKREVWWKVQNVLNYINVPHYFRYASLNALGLHKGSGLTEGAPSAAVSAFALAESAPSWPCALFWIATDSRFLESIPLTLRRAMLRCVIRT